MSDGAISRRSLAFIALLAGAVAIGFAPIFVRLSDTSPTASAFWRVALAAPVWAWTIEVQLAAIRSVSTVFSLDCKLTEPLSQRLRELAEHKAT